MLMTMPSQRPVTQRTNSQLLVLTALTALTWWLSWILRPDLGV